MLEFQVITTKVAERTQLCVSTNEQLQTISRRLVKAKVWRVMQTKTKRKKLRKIYSSRIFFSCSLHQRNRFHKRIWRTGGSQTALGWSATSTGVPEASGIVGTEAPSWTWVDPETLWTLAWPSSRLRTRVAFGPASPMGTLRHLQEVQEDSL